MGAVSGDADEVAEHEARIVVRSSKVPGRPNFRYTRLFMTPEVTRAHQ